MDYDDIKFTLLSDEQTFGSPKIDVIEELGGKCAISDFAILLGAYANGAYHADDDSSLKGRTCWWYLSSSDGDGDVRVVDKDGDRKWTYASMRSGGVRPTLPYSNIFDIAPHGVRGKSGFWEVEYGEYPQYAVDSSLGRTLESEFSASRLRKTGKTYTTDSRRWYDYSERFNPIEHEEFEYNGKRYVRVKSNCYENGRKLSNGVNVMPNDIVWLEVSPITWYADGRAKMLVSKTLLASGIRFCDDRHYKGDFENTEMYMFLNKYFAKDIVPLKTFSEKEEDTSEVEESFEVMNEIDAKILDIKNSLKEYHDKENIDSRITILLQNYQSNIDKALAHEEESDLVLTESSLDPETLSKQLLFELDELANEIKVNDEKKAVYISMYYLLNDALITLDGDTLTNTADNIVKSVYQIKKTIFQYFEDNKWQDELRELLNNLKLQVIAFIKTGATNEISKISTMREFRMLFGEKMIVYLARVMTDIHSSNALLKIKKEVIKQFDDNITKSNASYINSLLCEIEGLVKIINAEGTDAERAIARNIRDTELTNFTNTEAASLKIRDVFIKLYRMVLDIRERNGARAYRNKYSKEVASLVDKHVK